MTNTKHASPPRPVAVLKVTTRYGERFFVERRAWVAGHGLLARYTPRGYAVGRWRHRGTIRVFEPIRPLARQNVVNVYPASD